MNLVFLKKYRSIRKCGRTLRGAWNGAANAWIRFPPSHNGDLPYNLRGKYSFVDRRAKSKSLLIVLAGYKPDLWEIVFERVRRFAPTKMDVCIVTSGGDNAKINSICSKNGWSSLATRRNNICLAQNIAIHLHPDADWIFKIDEDMFLTDGFFEKLRQEFDLAKTKFRMEVGFTAPLIPVNGYGHVRILSRLNLVENWETRFGKLFFTEGMFVHQAVLQNPSAARFLWGEDCPPLSDIDKLNKLAEVQKWETTQCPLRFSIGAILFRRETWKDMGMFPVSRRGPDLGVDEEALCCYCFLRSRAIAIAERSVVGHLGFGPQTKEMMEFFNANKRNFEIKNV